MKRSTQLKSSTVPKRGRFDQAPNALEPGMEATPNRVEAICLQAKAKGLSTPSPGRAGAAFTMLQLTSSSAHESMGEMESGQTAKMVCKRFITLFEKKTKNSNGYLIMDIGELETRYGFDTKTLFDVLDVLVALEIVGKDEVSGIYVWFGYSAMFEFLARCTKIPQPEANLPCKAYLTRILAKKMTLQSKARMETTSETNSKQLQNDWWTFREIANVVSPDMNSPDIELFKVLNCFIAIGLMEQREVDNHGHKLSFMIDHVIDSLCFRWKLWKNSEVGSANIKRIEQTTPPTNGFTFSSASNINTIAPEEHKNLNSTQPTQSNENVNEIFEELNRINSFRYSELESSSSKVKHDALIRSRVFSCRESDKEEKPGDEKHKIGSDKPFSAVARNLLGLSAAKKSKQKNKSKDQEEEKIVKVWSTSNLAALPDDLALLTKLLRNNSKPVDRVSRIKNADTTISSQDTAQTSDDNESEPTSQSQQFVKPTVGRANSLLLGDRVSSISRSETIDSLTSIGLMQLNPELTDRDIESLIDV